MIRPSDQWICQLRERARELAALDPDHLRDARAGVAVSAQTTVRAALDVIRQQVESGRLSDMEMILLINEIEAIVAHAVAEHRRRYPTADVLQHEGLNS